MKTEIKGYELSKDYKELWELIHKGFRVPAWIAYTRKFPGEPIYDLVEVKMAYMSDDYDIGVRGRSYSGFDSTIEAFEANCESLELRWIKFNNN